MNFGSGLKNLTEGVKSFQVHLNKGRKFYTRNGLDWTKRFSQIAGAHDKPGQTIVDWEVVVIHEGRTNFSSPRPRPAVSILQR